MKSIIMQCVGVVVTVSSILFSPDKSEAVLFGQVSTAETLAPGSMDLGGFVTVFEHGTLVYGQYRHGLFANGDFGVQGGFMDPEGGDLGLALGVDMKFLLMRTDASVPFDLSLNPRFGYFNIVNASILSLGGSVVISRDYALEQGRLAPYGALNMRMESLNFDEDFGHPPTLSAGIADHIDDSQTDFKISGIAGVRWDISDLLDILGEVVFDEDLGFTIGLNFKL